MYICIYAYEKEKERQRITSFDCCPTFFDVNKLKPDYKSAAQFTIRL
jgi:hypothetical protein